jgi:hypothetical protein
MPKKLLATTVLTIVLVLVISIQVVVVDANPVPYPQKPNTDLPYLTIGIPPNSLPLNDNKAAMINIIVMQPDAWLSYYMGFLPYVGRCYGYVYLDGVMKLGFPSTQDKVNYCNISFTGYPDTVLRINGYNSSFTPDTVHHKLTIQLYCITFSQIGNYQSNVTQDVSFTIDSSSQTISFLETPVRTERGTYPTANASTSSIPTINITPTPALTPTSTPATSPHNTDFTIPAQSMMIILVASVIVILAVASVLLVYFRRIKGKP